MSGKRSYEDACAAAHALDLVGERWALLIAREMILGPKRFSDLRTGLPAISPNVLTQRLQELEQASVIVRRKLAPPAGAWVYELTEWGHGLEEIIMALGRWGVRSPQLPLGERAISVDGLILSFRSMFDPKQAAGFKAAFEFHFQEDVFHAEVAGPRFSIARGAARGPDTRVEADPNLLGGLAYGGVDLNTVLREGQVRLLGDKPAFKRFLTLFPLPERAPSTVQPATETGAAV
ncbi:MAG TPA: helix-turn-helix domain-containing protein [Burkholderiales bacterium]|jgi:DNA-binding HxlR family transcriptional regulator